MAHRFVIIGGGPAGNQAATYAARLGAKVTMVEREIVGGAAHLLDCIPSKTMIATGGAISFGQRIGGMGLADASTTVDEDALVRRIGSIRDHMQDDTTQLLQSQGVDIIRGTARFTGPHSVEVDTADGVQQLEFDSALNATGTRPRIPEWCEPDHERILTTR